MGNSKRTEKKKWSWKGRILYVLFLLVFVLVVGEVAVRLMGFSQWSPDHYTFKVSPGDSFFKPDDRLGFKGRPGPFQLTLSDSLVITVTHDEQGYRITGPALDTVDLRPQVWVFGCSFTHGYGVNDEENYTWMLQEAFPAYRFRNFGMDGYGTYHSLLQLEDLLKNQEIPDLVILGYGGFHDQRNVNNRYWKKALSGREMAEGIRFPYIRFDEAGELVPGIEPASYSPWPLMRISALMHYLENASNASENKNLRPYEVTRELIHQMHSKTSSSGGEFVVANIFQHEESTSMLNNLAPEIPKVDISIDLDEPTLRILPNDGHPNAKGHRMMADKLISFLQTHELLPDLAVKEDTIP